MKLTTVKFVTPVLIGGKWYEGIAANEGHVEELPTFPWCRVVVNGQKPRRTTLFNIAGCDDWQDEPAKGGKKP